MKKILTLTQIIVGLFVANLSFASQSIDFNFLLQDIAQKPTTSFTKELNRIMRHSLELGHQIGGSCYAAFSEFHERRETDIYVHSSLTCYSLAGSPSELSHEDMVKLIEKDLSEKTGITMSVPKVRPATR